MKKIPFSFIVLSLLSVILTVPGYGATVPQDGLPRNVLIEVEFKDFGNSSVKAGPIGPFRHSGHREYTRQYIVVSDGLTGSIRVGEDVPFIEYYTGYLFAHGYIESYQIDFKELGTKLTVTPKIRGDSVEISLTPQISYLAEGQREVINVTELTTSVIVANGQSMSIGGLIKDQEFKEWFFKSNNASNLEVILTPRIQ